MTAVQPSPTEPGQWAQSDVEKFRSAWRAMVDEDMTEQSSFRSDLDAALRNFDAALNAYIREHFGQQYEYVPVKSEQEPRP